MPERGEKGGARASLSGKRAEILAADGSEDLDTLGGDTPSREGAEVIPAGPGEGPFSG